MFRHCFPHPQSFGPAVGVGLAVADAVKSEEGRGVDDTGIGTLTDGGASAWRFSYFTSPSASCPKA